MGDGVLEVGPGVPVGPDVPDGPAFTEESDAPDELGEIPPVLKVKVGTELSGLSVVL